MSFHNVFTFSEAQELSPHPAGDDDDDDEDQRVWTHLKEPPKLGNVHV